MIDRITESELFKENIGVIDGEEWKRVSINEPLRDAYSQRYLVSNLGRVVSLARKKPKLMKETLVEGYYGHNVMYSLVSLSALGKATPISPTRLVAETFFNMKGNEENQVYTVDRNLLNANINNLFILNSIKYKNIIEEEYNKEKERRDNGSDSSETYDDFLAKVLLKLKKEFDNDLVKGSETFE